MTISISSQFDRSKVSKDKDYEGHLMVSIEARDPEFKRKPVSIALCLDVSGSMGWNCHSGESKIDALKEVARKIVENLTDKDELAIVLYTDNVTTLVQRDYVTNKEALYKKIAQLQPLRSTNMSGGMLEAYQQLAAVAVGDSEKKVQRVMLLTDGLANGGICTHDGLVELVKNQDSGATLSTFGFGTDADAELLADLAKAGGGNHYFIKDGKDIKDVFARELGGIISCLAQNIEVRVKPENAEVLEVLNDFTVEDDKGVAVIKAEDVYVDETKHVLLKLKVAKPNGKPKDRPFTVARVTVNYDDLKTSKRESWEGNVKVEFVKEEDADKEAILAVAEQVAVVTAAAAQIKAVQMANVGDFVGAQAEYTSGGIRLGDAAMRGSPVAISAQSCYLADQDQLTPDTYSEEIGTGMSASARGARRMRGTSKKGLSANLSNTVQIGMVASFQKGGSSAVEPELKIQGTVTGRTKTSEPNLSNEPKEEKGYTKTRSRSK